jgi:hypothetical protein
MSHRYIDSYPLERPQRADRVDADLLGRAVERVGVDFPAVGAVLYAAWVGAA